MYPGKYVYQIPYREESHAKKFNYEHEQAKNMKEKAEQHKTVGDELLRQSIRYANENNQKKAVAFCTEAAHQFVKSCEKVQKAAVAASGNLDAFLPQKSEGKPQKKVIESHNNHLISKFLSSQSGIQIVTPQNSIFVDKIHGGDGLSYIGLQYPDTNNHKLAEVTEEDCYKLQSITQVAHTNYENLVKKEKQASTILAALKSVGLA